MTRIQFRALSLVSVAPLKTSCGSFHAYVSLGGKQLVTTMSIHRTQEGGGSFLAPLAVDARITFIPAKPAARNKGARKLELTGRFNFPPTALPWGLADGARAKRVGPVVVDTNGDLNPDTLLPGTSNFAPDQLPKALTSDNKSEEFGSCCMTCHTDPSTWKQHCTYPSYCYTGYMCANNEL